MNITLFSRYKQLMDEENIEVIERELKVRVKDYDPDTFSYIALLYMTLADLYEIESRSDKMAEALTLGETFAKKSLDTVRDATASYTLANLVGRKIDQAIPFAVPVMAATVNKLHSDSFKLAKTHEIPMCYFQRGITKYFTPSAFGGGPGRANKDFERAIELDPNFSECILWMGMVCEKKKRKDEALVLYSRARSLRKSFKQADILIQKLKAEGRTYD